MEGRKRLPQGPRFTELSHIREPELDMRRHDRVQPGLFVRAYDMVRRLIANGGGIVSPMRSIGRELEESWPTGEQ